jgi:hypothetical protein
MLAAFKEIVNPAVIINIVSGDKLLTLKENSPESKIKKLHIKDVPENAFAFTLDHQVYGKEQRYFQQLSCYVNRGNDKGINKGCDLVLLVPQKNSHWMVLIFDLKSDKPRKEDTEKQLLNSELYVRYLISLVKFHYSIDTKDIKFKRTIVTTDKNSIRKTAIYRPNEEMPEKKNFRIVPVRVSAHNEAHVNLEKLLR